MNGKTKLIQAITIARVHSKADITAGDGAKHDILPGKAEYSTTTTSNVFQLLKECGLPVAFYVQDSPTSFLAPICEMLPFEVVVRRSAHGSYLKRNPTMQKGDLLPELLVEFYLKTSGKRWKEFNLACDDPLMEIHKHGGYVDLWKPNEPLIKGCHFLRLKRSEIMEHSGDWGLLEDMSELALMAFRMLRRAWDLKGFDLADFKIEFGLDESGKFYIADVIDNDSWRLLQDGEYMDKQIYRDGGNLKTVQENYAMIAHLTTNFKRYAHRLKKIL